MLTIERSCMEAELNDKYRLESKFLKFHEENPEIYDELVKLARQAKTVGRKKMGMKAIWEIMRWERMIKTKDASGYKLNNDYTSRYSRLIMEKEKDLKDFFETRKLRAD